MDAGTVLGMIGAYVAAGITVFLLYSPVIVLFVCLLLTAGVVQLLVWPFLVLFRKLRRKPEAPSDNSWLLR
jgi:hypothetical protein